MPTSVQNFLQHKAHCCTLCFKTQTGCESRLTLLDGQSESGRMCGALCIWSFVQHVDFLQVAWSGKNKINSGVSLFLTRADTRAVEWSLYFFKSNKSRKWMDSIVQAGGEVYTLYIWSREWSDGVKYTATIFGHQLLYMAFLLLRVPLSKTPSSSRFDKKIHGYTQEYPVPAETRIIM